LPCPRIWKAAGNTELITRTSRSGEAFPLRPTGWRFALKPKNLNDEADRLKLLPSDQSSGLTKVSLVGAKRAFSWVALDGCLRTPMPGSRQFQRGRFVILRPPQKIGGGGGFFFLGGGGGLTAGPELSGTNRSAAEGRSADASVPLVLNAGAGPAVAGRGPVFSIAGSEAVRCAFLVHGRTKCCAKQRKRLW